MNAKKSVFSSELAYVFGVLLIQISICIMTKCDFGLSMIVSPAYILHVKISEFLPFFSFGMSSYTLQFVLLVFMVLLIRKFKMSYLFAFVTSVICGVVLDFINYLARGIAFESIYLKIPMFFLGIFICGLGVAFMFRTYISPEAYDLFVKEISTHFSINTSKFKTCFDISFCTLAVILSFLLFGFGNFVGVKIGTVICAILNGPVIGFFGKLLDKRFVFEPAIKFKNK